MKYIELPTGIIKLNHNEEGPFFNHEGQDFNLEDIASQAKEGWFHHEKTGLKLSVTPSCPKLDKYYVEYLDKSWCHVTNGLNKAKEIQDMLERDQPYTARGHFHEKNLEKRAEKLKERKQGRYEKGNLSV